MAVSGSVWVAVGEVRGSGNDDSSNSEQVQQSMAGWSIAQNPLLLSRDQPCNVLGNFCKGLTYCQQRNLFLHQDTRVPHKVTQAGSGRVEYPSAIFRKHSIFWKILGKQSLISISNKCSVCISWLVLLDRFGSLSCWRHFSFYTHRGTQGNVKFIILFLPLCLHRSLKHVRHC